MVVVTASAGCVTASTFYNLIVLHFCDTMIVDIDCENLVFKMQENSLEYVLGSGDVSLTWDKSILTSFSCGRDIDSECGDIIW